MAPTKAGKKFTKQELKQLFAEFAQKRVLIIGDAMLDSYWWGSVEHISPEAPVPVVLVKERENRLGGAANVAVNLRQMGAEAILAAAIGKDPAGDDFKALLKEQGISTDHLLISDARPTTVKTRIIGNKHQLLRVDNEVDDQLGDTERKVFLKQLLPLVEKVDVIIFEDYDKGLLGPQLISKVIETANKAGVPVLVDPKRKNFLTYKNATLFKPNLKEMREGLKVDLPKDWQMADLRWAVDVLMEKLNLEMAMVTLSEKGIYIKTNKQEEHHISAHIRNVYDVSGAGDTVSAVAALALAAGLPPHDIAEIANLSGGIVCEFVGVVPIDPQRLFEECLKL